MYKKQIFECLDRLKGLNPGNKVEAERCATLKREADQINDEGTLFQMLQVIREAISSVTGEDCSFQVQMPDGKVKKFNNLAEMHKSGYKPREAKTHNPSGRTTGRQYRRS